MRRLLWLTFGWICVVLAFVGIPLPGLPTTPFALLALWAFSKSSNRFHAWIGAHRVLGPYVRDWESNRVIPIRAKVVALTCMIGSLAYLIAWDRLPTPALVGTGAVMFYGAYFILTKPSQPAVDESRGPE